MATSFRQLLHRTRRFLGSLAGDRSMEHAADVDQAEAELLDRVDPVAVEPSRDTEPQPAAGDPSDTTDGADDADRPPTP